MVMSVTGRGNGRRARLFAPRSHALTKLVGETITASWTVKNNGGVAGTAFLQISFTGPGTAFLGDAAVIPAGATVTLSLSGVISTLVPGLTYPAVLQVRALAPATVAPGSFHQLTVTIPSIAPPPILGLLDLFYAPGTNWINNPSLQPVWLEAIRAFYGILAANFINVLYTGDWVIFSVNFLQDVTQNLGRAPVIPGLNA